MWWSRGLLCAFVLEAGDVAVELVECVWDEVWQLAYEEACLFEDVPAVGYGGVCCFLCIGYDVCDHFSFLSSSGETCALLRAFFIVHELVGCVPSCGFSGCFGLFFGPCVFGLVMWGGR